MSEYGGIIGGAVGAVVGFYVGGPAGAKWGWMVGSSLGGAYAASQQVIPGPQIGEIQQQTAQEGGPMPIVFGRSHPIAGNIIASGEPQIVQKRERQGKGGPQVESKSVYRTYAVGFCEGPITAFLQVWRNNTLVYNAEDPGMAAENAAFLKYARFFTGAWDQMPSPDLEAVHGAGNVSAYRGRAYMVLAKEDVTDQRGAWSQWKVRVMRCEGTFLTSPPYPIEETEGVGMASAPEAGRLMMLPHPVDQLSLSSVPLGGDLFVGVQTYTPPPDEIALASVPLGGDLFATVKTYDAGLESVALESIPLGGDLYADVLAYEPDTEAVGLTSIPLSGDLS